MAATAPIERKVTAATLGSLAAAVAITLLNATTGTDLLGGAPAWVQHLATLLAPPLVTFLAGYQASHTPRTTPQQ